MRIEAAPALQRMVELAVVEAGDRLLCYGCGQGADVRWLRQRKFNATGYDPHPPFGYAGPPQGKFDFVFVIYLMTRLKTDSNRRKTIARAFEHVRPGGHLVLVSRNWQRLAADAGAEGRDGAIAYFTGLMGDCAYDRVEAPALDEDGQSLCLMALKEGTYRPRNPVEWIDSQERVAALCRQLEEEPFIGLDVETTLDLPRKLCTIQLGTPKGTWIVDARAVSEFAPIRALMENPRVEKIIHNADFEEGMLRKHEVRIVNIFDTLPASRRKYRKKKVEGGHKLGEVCERELGIYMDKGLQTSDWTQRPLSSEQLDYAAIDAEVLIGLYHVFKPPKPPENLELFG